MSPPVAKRNVGFADPSACEKCGAVYTKKKWWPEARTTYALLAKAKWVVCPGCAQMGAKEWYGRVLVRGTWVPDHVDEVTRRVENVAARAGRNQPLRRIVSVERTGDELEVLATSQKLAHRIVHELKKAFRGKATYSWADDDGALFATWSRDRASTGAKRPARP